VSHWLDEYKSKTTKSRQLFDRASHVLPGGVSYAIRDFAPYPFYVHHASGANLWDLDGNAYKDYWLGHGALILGHAHPRVIEAVTQQVRQGSHYGFSHVLEVELAELVTRMVPSAEMVRFTSSGTEANMYAVRLARTYTGRQKIAKFEGGWHGGYDVLQVAVHAPFDKPESGGIDPKSQENTVVLPFNDLGQAEQALRKEEIAGVLIEPVLGVAGFIDADREFLIGLKKLCEERGTLLMFDEVITGFRLAPGGAQQLFGVKPDITVLGKILGGGFPIGGICGRRDVFEKIDHRGIPDASRRSFHGGTFSGNPVSMAAGIATLNELQHSQAYDRLGGLGEKTRRELGHAAAKHEVEASITGIGSTFCIHFQKDRPRDARQAARDDLKKATALHDYLLSKHVIYVSPTNPHMFLSTEHTEQDIDKLLIHIDEFFEMTEK